MGRVNIQFKLYFKYPNLNYVNIGRAEWKIRAKELSEKINNGFSRVEQFYSAFEKKFLALNFYEFGYPMICTLAKEKDYWEKEITFSIPHLTPSLLVSMNIFLQHILGTHIFNYAYKVRFTIQITQVQDGKLHTITLFEEYAKIVKFYGYLSLKNKPKLLEYYEKVAPFMVTSCQGYPITADQLKRGETLFRRHIRKDGKKDSISINGPDEIVNYIKEEDFGGFYHSVQKSDKTVGMGVIDLDPKRGIKQVLGQKVLWKILFKFAGDLVKNASSHGLEGLAIKFSGEKASICIFRWRMMH